jgi:uncharacterized protein YbjT (DUF2867 family)
MVETVLVTGATGTTGSELVRLLGNHDVHVRAGVHTPPNAPAWGSDVEVVGVDFADPDSLSTALDGVSKLYLLTPFVPDPETLVEPAIEAAADAGVEHVVRHSAIGAGTGDRLPMRWHRAAERAVEESGVAYTHLRPTFFMQNLLGQAESIADGTFYSTVRADAKISHLDARDVASVAATILTEEGHEGAAYDLTGPAALTFPDVADALSDALGHEVSYVRVSEADQRGVLIERGMPEALVDGFLDLLAWAETGDAAVVATGVADVTAVSPTAFETFVHDHTDAFRAA